MKPRSRSGSATSPPRPWRVVTDEHVQHCKVFDVHRTQMESPTNGTLHPFFRIESAEWVNIVPLTASRDLVLIRQFRQGSGSITLEVPGGMVDPGEAPAEAGARELLEETGYRADRFESLGSINPNPALFTNRVHMFVALDCESVAPIQNSSTEETAVELLPLSELRATLGEGRIDHALVVATLYHFELWRSERET